MLNRDIRLPSEKKLKAHKRLTYDILDGMVDWVRVIDKNGVVIYTNKTMEEDLGTNLVGSKCFFSLGKDHPCQRCITQTTIATGVIAEKEEQIGDRLFSVKSSPVRDVDGNIYASVEVFRDVTRERKLEKQLIEKNRKMNKDLQFSRKLQQQILPEKGEYGGVAIDYIYRPSELLSGDMFDVFKIDDEHTGIYISDVAGHGVAASMMTMFIRQTMRAIKVDNISPGKVLSELHNRFLDLNLDDDQYFTIFYAVINHKNETMTYANGGHNSIPILIRENDISLLEVTGFPISYLFESIDYQENTISIGKGDQILLYTDGIIEARNKDDEQFGLDRLLSLVRHHQDACIQAIEGKIDSFKYSTQDDDFALVKAEIIQKN